MTLSEFKAWFEGFTEQMDGPPSAKQWKRIQKRVREIDGVAYPVVINHPYWRDWTPAYSACSANNTSMGTASLLYNSGKAEWSETA